MKKVTFKKREIWCSATKLLNYSFHNVYQSQMDLDVFFAAVKVINQVQVVFVCLVVLSASNHRMTAVKKRRRKSAILPSLCTEDTADIS